MRDFKKLKIWQKAMEIVFEVYELVKAFPSEEKFGLRSQVTRATVSIASNIAEGSARKGDKEFTRFLYMSMGSASELEYFAILIADLGLLKKPEARKIETDAAEVKRMLSGLIASLPLQHDLS